MQLTDELLKAADKFVMDNDRLMYRPYFECAEQFCSDNSVLIGGRTGINILIGGSLTRDDFVWDLYCDNAFAIAKSLATELATIKSHIPSDTVAVQTNIKHREFTIYIQARMLFRLFAMDKYRGIKLIDVMSPPSLPGYFTDVNVKCVSADVHLIDIYRTLYSPSVISSWERELETERLLFSMVTKNGSTGGEDVDIKVGGLSGNEYHEIILQAMKIPFVVIGEYAIKDLGGSVNPSRLQIITSEDISVVNRAVERIINNKKLTIINVKYNLNLLNDFQLVKFTIYVSDGKRQSAIMDVFNSTQYELIPYSDGGELPKKMIANPWVILRFLFIDNWILSLVKRLETRNGSDSESFDNKIRNNLNIAKWVRSIATFNVDKLTGVFTSESVAKKKLIKDLGERFPMYYPAKTGGKYRFVTQPINFVDNIWAKTKIIKKITKMDVNMDSQPISDGIINVLRDYEKTITERSGGSSPTNWGTNKSVESVYIKNKQILDYIKQPIRVYLDIGCGSGLDACAISNKYKPARSICADVTDTRMQSDSNCNIEFMLIDPEKPISLDDASVDLVTMFHVIHHMNTDPIDRIKDIARLMTPGGLLMIKDHDVQSSSDADLVDFEHFVYMISDGSHSLEDLTNNFPALLPMKYYNAKEVTTLMGPMFKLIWSSSVSKLNRAYSAVYQRTDQ